MAPLTVFAGANSSGKSTLLQSILLVAQTLTHRVRSRSVVLNGTLVRLGKFNDVKNAHHDAKQIRISWELHPSTEDSGTMSTVTLPFTENYSLRNPISAIECDMSFEADPSEGSPELAQIQPHLDQFKLTVTPETWKDSGQKDSISVNRLSGVELGRKIDQMKFPSNFNFDEAIRDSLKYHVQIDDSMHAEIRREKISAIPIGCILDHFLPRMLLISAERVSEDARLISDFFSQFLSENVDWRGFNAELQELDREVLVPVPVIKLLCERLKGDSQTAHKPNLMKICENSDSTGISLQTIMETLNPALHPINKGQIRSPLAQVGRGVIPLLGRFRRLRIERKDGDEKMISREFVRDEISKTDPHSELEVLEVFGYPIPSRLSASNAYLERFFSTQVRYLGPIRDGPKSHYPLLSTADPSDVGLKGQYTAAVMDAYKNETVRYVPVAEFIDRGASGKVEVKRVSLQEAVAEWLDYLDLATKVLTQDKGKFGHELKVKLSEDDVSHDLTHVGVGVSQVLPIVVVGLLSESGTTLIFEQPELHLHPKVQSRLGDFFLSLSRLGKQCIIESHSEYVINRIRCRIAQDSGDNWLRLSKVYFVERSNGDSQFTEVKLNKFGAIVDWPRGFFDQSVNEAESILAAAIRKRRSLRG